MGEKYGLAEPFDTEGLEGTPELCFALGVEWSMFREKMLAESDPFTFDCTTANAKRLCDMAKRHGRTATEHWIHDDYHEWRTLRIGGATD